MIKASEFNSFDRVPHKKIDNQLKYTHMGRNEEIILRIMNSVNL